MRLDGRFSEIWKGLEEFEFTRPEEQPDLCVFALAFSEWFDWLMHDIVTDEPTVIFVNQAKVLLVDKYFEWRNSVGKNHRNRIGEAGHTCIFHVFDQGYERLREIELALMRPLLFSPPKPAPPPGLYLGDLENSDQ
jgi:hypothetical protein